MPHFPRAFVFGAWRHVRKEAKIQILGNWTDHFNHLGSLAPGRCLINARLYDRSAGWSWQNTSGKQSDAKTEHTKGQAGQGANVKKSRLRVNVFLHFGSFLGIEIGLLA